MGKYLLRLAQVTTTPILGTWLRGRASVCSPHASRDYHCRPDRPDSLFPLFIATLAALRPHDDPYQLREMPE
jgi:hypothetical protein